MNADNQTVALYITAESNRRALLQHSKARGHRIVNVYEGFSPTQAKRAWDELTLEAHRGEFSLIALSDINEIPGGLFHRLREMRRLTNTGVHIESPNQQWLDLSGCQTEMLNYILEQHAQQTRDRIVVGFNKAKAEGRKVGRPRVTVDNIEEMAIFRSNHSLRETARRFRIGTSTAWRILKAYSEARSHLTLTAAMPILGAKA